ncbi:MAG: LysR family transcriptional regulator, partial [Bradyrhizobium sp.]|nr:LysR family transcriptional regulator [Bradyrhizobium sp.]
MRWLIVASQYRSLRRAAEVLNVRQSTLSRRLRDLECRLGTVLFERSTGGTQPTAAGREFLKVAHRIVAETDAAFSRLSAYCRGESGELSIGIYMALSAGNLRATLQEHRRRFPGVEIRVVDGACTSLLSDLATGSLDVAVLAGTCTNWADRSLPLWNERVVVALPEGHPLCAKEAIRWAELKTEPLLINRRDPGPEFHRLLMAKLGCHEL